MILCQKTQLCVPTIWKQVQPGRGIGVGGGGALKGFYKILMEIQTGGVGFTMETICSPVLIFESKFGPLCRRACQADTPYLFYFSVRKFHIVIVLAIEGS